MVFDFVVREVQAGVVFVDIDDHVLLVKHVLHDFALLLVDFVVELLEERLPPHFVLGVNNNGEDQLRGDLEKPEASKNNGGLLGVQIMVG